MLHDYEYLYYILQFIYAVAAATEPLDSSRVEMRKADMLLSHFHRLYRLPKSRLLVKSVYSTYRPRPLNYITQLRELILIALRSSDINKSRQQATSSIPIECTTMYTVTLRESKWSPINPPSVD